MNLAALAALAVAGMLGLSSCRHDKTPDPMAATTPAAIKLVAKEQAVSARADLRAAKSQVDTDEAQDAIQHDPSASDLIDPALRSDVLAHIKRVRADGDAGADAGLVSEPSSNQVAPPL